MPGSVASTEAGDSRVTPTTTRNSSPAFLPMSSDEPQISQLSLDDAKSGLSSEETVSQKRREWYPIAWKKLLEKNNYDGVITAVNRYLEITDKANIDLDCYFAYMIASASKKGSDASILDKVDMTNPSDSDLVDIHLLRCLVFLKYNDVDTALEEGKVASEKAFHLGLQDSCHFILGLVACYSEDYVEAAFRKSLLPEGFQLKPRFVELIRKLTFKDAKWSIRGSMQMFAEKPRYSSPVDITKELPIPPQFII
ncbi:hypothetical protein TWF481_004120 [Arthrobotrys musiformis]|uniref:Uncharacterized protein n=1 Tax=Arthrobotrys musiformis TaxID=47236 RepID=A0AAV9WIK7_9PEZI